MSRFCHIQNCDSPAVVIVRGHWYCSEHKPIDLFEREDNKLLTGEEYDDK